MKRVFDFLVSLLLLVFLSPLIIFISLIIKLTSEGPAFFRQKRIGKDNNEFEILKFRTMKINTPNVATHLLGKSESFITPVGKILRKTSLDELPQLINILKGDMSLVGPRPALYNQYDLKNLRTKVGVHKLMPGLTGWAQINGRDEIPLNKKVEFDMEYMKIMGFWTDIKIIFMTIFKVLKSEGISEGTK
ncbi:sugar transferase [Clostridium tarantellae]|uniref:Sugar transferase n=1 Tax=Clostridium tarantellae TaxID=39493 RepID=A0A6I1MJE2_9CLOT|nr:sugar transferase [Clostridium tarantellae]MPQ43505.1 sugar transferase [Clostridium tarantellae]